MIDRPVHEREQLQAEVQLAKARAANEGESQGIVVAN